MFRERAASGRNNRERLNIAIAMISKLTLIINNKIVINTLRIGGMSHKFYKRRQ